MKKNKTILIVESKNNRNVEKIFIENNFNVLAVDSINNIFNDIFKSNPVDADAIVKAIEYLENLEKVDAIWLDEASYIHSEVDHFIKKFETSRPEIRKIPIFVISNNENTNKKTSYDLNIIMCHVKDNKNLKDVIESLNSQI